MAYEEIKNLLSDFRKLKEDFGEVTRETFRRLNDLEIRLLSIEEKFDSEPITAPDTPLAKRISSMSMKAVSLPPKGEILRNVQDALKDSDK
jgi:hypothetical protein